MNTLDNAFGYCVVCGAQVGEETCEKCEILSNNPVAIRALPNGVVLINYTVSAYIHTLWDQATNSLLYYGTLEKFPNAKTQVYKHRCTVLSALLEADTFQVVEIPN